MQRMVSSLCLNPEMGTMGRPEPNGSAMTTTGGGAEVEVVILVEPCEQRELLHGGRLLAASAALGFRALAVGARAGLGLFDDLHGGQLLDVEAVVVPTPLAAAEHRLRDLLDGQVRETEFRVAIVGSRRASCSPVATHYYPVRRSLSIRASVPSTSSTAASPSSSKPAMSSCFASFSSAMYSSIVPAASR